MSNTNANQAVMSQVRSMASELGFGDLPPSQQEELIVQATEALLKRIFIETFEKVPREFQNEFLEIAESENSEEMEKFLHIHIPSYDGHVAKVVSDFKTEMKAASL